jgi:hypothetical protein
MAHNHRRGSQRRFLRPLQVPQPGPAGAVRSAAWRVAILMRSWRVVVIGVRPAAVREPAITPAVHRVIPWYGNPMSASVSAVKRGRGRPSLSGVGDSPQIRVRVDAALRRRAEEEARRRGLTVSMLTRQALEERLNPTRREERVQLELHKAVVGHLLTDLEGVRAQARTNLDRGGSAVHGATGRAWLAQWRTLLDGDPAEMLQVMLREDEYGIDMRQVSPFTGVLSDDERLTAISRAAARAQG